MSKIDFRHDLLPLKNKLFRLAYRVTLNYSEAEDLTQDTLLKVWNKRNELEDIENIEAYCMTVCRNLSLDRNNSKTSHQFSLDEDTIVEKADHSRQPDEQLEYEDKLHKVQLLIHQLPEKQRVALELRDIEEKSYKEIANIMEITEDNVKVLIHRARTTIREKYEKFDNYGL